MRLGPTHGDGALMILQLYCTGSLAAMGLAALAIKHRAEIAHVEPAFREVK
jgi:hypothetical protein